jgi:hypothetical protein
MHFGQWSAGVCVCLQAGPDAGKGLYREALIYEATTIYESTLTLYMSISWIRLSQVYKYKLIKHVIRLSQVKATNIFQHSLIIQHSIHLIFIFAHLHCESYKLLGRQFINQSRLMKYY